MPIVYQIEIPDSITIKDLSGDVSGNHIIMLVDANTNILLLDVNSTLLKVTQGGATNNPPTIQIFKVINRVLNVRTEPNTNASVVRRLYSGNTVKVSGKRERWGDGSTTWLWGQLEDGSWIALGELANPGDINDNTLSKNYVELSEGTGG